MAVAQNGCLWQQITNELVEYLQKDDLRDGDPFLSTDDISKRYKVSNITGRRVLSELERIGLIDKGRGRGCRVRKRGELSEVLLIVDVEEGLDVFRSSHIFFELQQGIAEAALRSNCTIKAVTPEYVQQLPANQELNVIILQQLPKSTEVMARLCSDNVNCVLCHSLEPDPRITSIIFDFQLGAVKAVEYLINKGYRKIGLITSNFTGKWFLSRFEGYLNVLKNADITINFSWIKESIPSNTESVTKAIDDLMQMDDRPEAVFAASDAIGIRILKYCQTEGIKVPEDLAVIGFDNIPEAAITTPPLTTIDIDWRQMGNKAFEQLSILNHTNKKDRSSIVMNPQLITRESV